MSASAGATVALWSIEIPARRLSFMSANTEELVMPQEKKPDHPRPEETADEDAETVDKPPFKPTQNGPGDSPQWPKRFPPKPRR